MIPCRRPRLEFLEDRRTPSGIVGAVRDPKDFAPSFLEREDDNSHSAFLGFSINFLGKSFDQLFVNNNGNLTFDSSLSAYAPIPLELINRNIISPFFADVDTRNPESGQVLYGQGSVEDHPAFVVTWDCVGFYNSRADLLNRFQVVIIGRSDLGPGDFDLEYNYAQIEWDNPDNGVRVGFANTDGAVYELPVSGVASATLDTSDTGLARTRTGSDVVGRHLFLSRGGVITPNQEPKIETIPDQQLLEGQSLQLLVKANDPDGGPLVYSLDTGGAQASFDPSTGVVTLLVATPGSYTFVVTATDEYGLASRMRFPVNVVNVPPLVEVGNDTLASRGESFARNITFVDPGSGSVRVFADYGDGTQPEPLTLNADGSYRLSHVFAGEGNYRVRVTVDDGFDATTELFSVAVLPDADMVSAQKMVALQPGQKTQLDLSEPGSGRKLLLSIERAADADPDGAALEAFYRSNPTDRPIEGQFFDVQIRNPHVDDVITIEYDAGQRVNGLRVKYYDQNTRTWRDVPAEIVRTATGIRLTIKDTSILGGTVFAVGVTSGGTTVTSVARPPVASSASNPSVATASVIQFTSRTQLSLTVTATQERQLTAGSAVGNQSGGNRVTTLASTSNVGGNQDDTEEDEEEKQDNDGNPKKKDEKNENRNNDSRKKAGNPKSAVRPGRDRTPQKGPSPSAPMPKQGEVERKPNRDTPPSESPETTTHDNAAEPPSTGWALAAAAPVARSIRRRQKRSRRRL